MPALDLERSGYDIRQSQRELDAEGDDLRELRAAAMEDMFKRGACFSPAQAARAAYVDNLRSCTATELYQPHVKAFMMSLERMVPSAFTLKPMVSVESAMMTTSRRRNLSASTVSTQAPLGRTIVRVVGSVSWAGTRSGRRRAWGTVRAVHVSVCSQLPRSFRPAALRRGQTCMRCTC